MGYRIRMVSEIKYGEFGAYLTTLRTLMSNMEANGLRSGRALVPTAGRNNEIVWEIEYPDLATYQKENEAFYAVREVFEAFRSGAPYVVQGSSRVEIYEDVPAAFPTP